MNILDRIESRDRGVCLGPPARFSTIIWDDELAMFRALVDAIKSGTLGQVDDALQAILKDSGNG